MNTRLALLLPALALVASCGGDGPTTVVGFNGSLVLSYSGQQSGSFNASGALPSSSSGQFTNAWAAAQATATTEMLVVGVSPRSASTHDFVDIFIQRNTVGSEDIDASCGFNCNGVALTIGVNNSGPGFTASCYLTDGTIAITEKSAQRMKGTFSGTGECVNSSAATGAFTVTNGSFDVAIVPDVP